VLREYVNEGGQWRTDRDSIYRDGLLLAAEGAQGRRHFHLDHLGTPRLITNRAGWADSYHVYYPFGEEATAFNQDSDRMKFTGHERDLASPAGAGDDLDSMHARHCSPITGRFLSVDPAGASFDPRAPQSWNRYSYVQNRPMVAADPTGEVLSFTGSREGKNVVQNLANGDLFGQDLVIDSAGNTTLQTNGEVGPPTREQQAAASIYGAIIGHSETATLSIGVNSSDVLFGSYENEAIDIADISKVGSGPAATASGVLLHEVAESAYKQFNNLPSVLITMKGLEAAHRIGIAAQNRANTFERINSTRSELFNNGNLVTRQLLVNGSAAYTVTVVWRNGNVHKIVQQPF
jgi:RHS repeat-associated protein